jgi:choline monooxygenase
VHKLVAPGDVVPVTVGRVPVLLVRDHEGQVRGFLNICRHRAYAVATDEGNQRKLRCRYHSWTYDLDGTLVAAPRCEHEPGFDRRELGLLPVSVDEFCGFVFVNPNPAAPPLRDVYPGIDDAAARWRIDFEGYRYVDRWRFDVPVNWKAWVENSTECYHCPTIHSRTFNAAFETKWGDGGYQYVTEGRLMLQSTPFRPRSRWRSGSVGTAEEGSGFRFVYFYPGSSFALDEYVAMANSYVPLSPGKSESVVDVYLHPDADSAFLDEWMEMHKAVLDEDVVAMVGQQPGLNAHQMIAGKLMPVVESPIAEFHRLLWSDLRNAVEAVARSSA